MNKYFCKSPARAKYNLDSVNPELKYTICYAHGRYIVNWVPRPRISDVRIVCAVPQKNPLYFMPGGTD